MPIVGSTLTHEITPRFRDTDAMGHINNAVCVTHPEVARQEYWHALTRHALTSPGHTPRRFLALSSGIPTPGPRPSR